MASKYSENKSKVFLETESKNDSQYSNLNLNGTQKCLMFNNPIPSKSKSLKNGRKDIGFPANFSSKSTNFELEESDKSLKEYKHLNVYGFNEENKQNQKLKNSSNFNSKNLSLHISAYENSNDGNDTVSGGENEGLKMKEINGKQIFTYSSSFIQNPYEFPRQQQGENQSNDPEVMQFKASQRLLNPNLSSENGFQCNGCHELIQFLKSELNKKDETIKAQSVQNEKLVDHVMMLTSKLLDSTTSETGGSNNSRKSDGDKAEQQQRSKSLNLSRSNGNQEEETPINFTKGIHQKAMIKHERSHHQHNKKNKNGNRNRNSNDGETNNIKQSIISP